MKKWPLGSEVRRKVITRGAMLYDAFRAGNLVPEMFDPPFWAQHGLLEGTARGGRGTTHFVRADGHEWVLRHYHRGGLVSRVTRDRYFWRGERRVRSIVEWQLTYHMHRAGLPVPAPLGARYVRRGLRYTADLITERLPEAQSLAECLQLGALSVLNWIAIGRVIRRFHDFGVCHADLNAHNVILGAGDSVYLIDFDRCVLRKPGWWCDANLVRLRRSLEKISYALPSDRFTEADWHGLLDGYNVSSGVKLLQPVMVDSQATAVATASGEEPQGPHVWRNLPVTEPESRSASQPVKGVSAPSAKAAQDATTQVGWSQAADSQQAPPRAKAPPRAPVTGTGKEAPPAPAAKSSAGSPASGSTGWPSSGEPQAPRGTRVPQGSQWAQSDGANGSQPPKVAPSAQGASASEWGKDARNARGAQPSQSVPPPGSEWGKDTQSTKGAQSPQTNRTAPGAKGPENAAGSSPTRDSQSPPAGRSAQSAPGAGSTPAAPPRKDAQPGARSAPPSLSATQPIKVVPANKPSPGDQSGSTSGLQAKEPASPQSVRPATGSSGEHAPERNRSGQSGAQNSATPQSPVEWPIPGISPDSRPGRGAPSPQAGGGADKTVSRDAGLPRDGQLSSTGKLPQLTPGSVGRSPPVSKESGEAEKPVRSTQTPTAVPGWRDTSAPKSGVTAEAEKSARPQPSKDDRLSDTGRSQLSEVGRLPRAPSSPASSASKGNTAHTDSEKLDREVNPASLKTARDTSGVKDRLSQTGRSLDPPTVPVSSLSASKDAQAANTAPSEDDKFDWEPDSPAGTDVQPLKDRMSSQSGRSPRPAVSPVSSLSASKDAQAAKDTAFPEDDKFDWDLDSPADKNAQSLKGSPPSETGRFARAGASSASKGAQAPKEDSATAETGKGSSATLVQPSNDAQVSEPGKLARTVQSSEGSSTSKDASVPEAGKAEQQESSQKATAATNPQPPKEAPVSETGKVARLGQTSSSSSVSSGGSKYTKWLKESTRAKDGSLSSTGKLAQLNPGSSGNWPKPSDTQSTEASKSGSTASDAPLSSSPPAQSSPSPAQSIKAPGSSTDQGGQDSQDSMDWEFFGEETTPPAKTPKPPPRT